MKKSGLNAVIVDKDNFILCEVKYDAEAGDHAPIMIKKIQAMENTEFDKELNMIDEKIFFNSPLARVLYNEADVGDEIPTEVYMAVAFVLAECEAIAYEYEEIVGYEEVKEKFHFILYRLEYQKELVDKDIHFQQGALLYGDKNHGKAFMAKVFAKQTNRYICEVNSFDNKDKVKSKLNSLSLKLRTKKKCILLLYNLDITLKQSKKIIRRFLDEYKGEDLFVLATAETKQCVDKWQGSGYLSECIYVGETTLNETTEMVKHILNRMEVESEASVEDIAKIYEGKSYSDIDANLGKAYALSYMTGSEKLQKKDIMKPLFLNEYEDFYANQENEMKIQKNIVVHIMRLHMLWLVNC